MMKIVEMLFDYASPWAYLADAILDRKLEGIEIVHRPIYIRGLEGFSKGLPYSGAKLEYLMQDLKRCAAHEGVPLAAPPVFPINGLYVLRGAIAAQRAGLFSAYHSAVFHGAWRDGRDVSTLEAARAIAREVGVDPDAIDDPLIKGALRASTEEAAKRGAFGVPTFFVEGEMFWGHDRLDYVARAAAILTRGC